MGVVLGSVAALNRGKWIDNVIIVIATCGIAVPSFVVCTILLYIFSLKLGWLPSYGLTGWKNYIMPVIALGFYPTAYICRLMRSSMLDVLGQDYMRTARAKGLSQGKSLFKHALRNAILPVVTYLGPALAYTLTLKRSLRSRAWATASSALSPAAIIWSSWEPRSSWPRSSSR